MPKQGSTGCVLRGHVVPILMPVVRQLGIEPIHYIILVIASIGIGLFVPPIGVGLVVGVGKVPMANVMRPMMPFLAVLAIGLAVLSIFPWFTTVLPTAAGVGK